MTMAALDLPRACRENSHFCAPPDRREDQKADVPHFSQERDIS